MSEVLSERVSVCIRLVSTTVSKVSEVRRDRFSRMRSNTTMVSWTEKPMTVRMAVRKSVVHLEVEEVAEDRPETQDHEGIVQQRDDGAGAEPDAQAASAPTLRKAMVM